MCLRIVENQQMMIENNKKICSQGKPYEHMRCYDDIETTIIVIIRTMSTVKIFIATITATVLVLPECLVLRLLFALQAARLFSSFVTAAIREVV